MREADLEKKWKDDRYDKQMHFNKILQPEKDVISNICKGVSQT